MTKTELLLRMGELYTNEELEALVRERMEQVRTEAPDWRKEWTRCPNCSREGFVIPDFGVKKIRGVERKQSWCARCRASTSYYLKKTE